MARYIERVENMTRAAEEAHSASLLPEAVPREEWERLLVLTNRWDDFVSRYGPSQWEKILPFVVLDLKNPSSILSSLRSARENARLISGSVSSELWVSLNDFWGDLGEVDENRLTAEDLPSLFDHLKKGVWLFRGTVQGMLEDDDALRFIGLGTFLERADHLSRLLSLMCPPLSHEANETATYFRWRSFVRMAGGHKDRPMALREKSTPRLILEGILFCEGAGHSLHVCIGRVDELLGHLSEPIGGEAVQRGVDLHLFLHERTLQEPLGPSLRSYLLEFSESLWVLGKEIDRSLGLLCV